MKNKKENHKQRISEIAESLYMQSQKKGHKADAIKNWLKAEDIYGNKYKYFLWCICNFLNRWHFEIVTAVSIVSLLMTISLALWTINIDRNSSSLTNRPYISIDIENPIRFVQQNDVFYGGDIVIKNEGKISASKVDAHFYITTDLDKANMEGLEWFEKNLGGRSAISFIAPGAFVRAPGFRSLSPSAEYYYFEAIISYEGLNRNKKYWTHIKKVFYVHKGANALYPVFTFGEWDRNNKFSPPSLITGKAVTGLMEDFKSKKLGAK